MVGLWCAAHAQGKTDVLLNRHVGIERISLEHHVHVTNHLAFDLDLFGDEFLKTRDRPQGRGLASARGPGEHHEFLVLDIQIDGINAHERAPGPSNPAKFSVGHIFFAALPCFFAKS